MELTVAAFLAHLPPAIRLYEGYEVFDFHIIRAAQLVFFLPNGLSQLPATFKRPLKPIYHPAAHAQI
jgi:hypothetical protein